eukprot:14120472-Alexandrium_andersonii.AAC.1
MFTAVPASEPGAVPDDVWATARMCNSSLALAVLAAPGQAAAAPDPMSLARSAFVRPQVLTRRRRRLGR